ncbi:MAG: MutS-related protein [Anaerolineae bacterium]
MPAQPSIAGGGISLLWPAQSRPPESAGRRYPAWVEDVDLDYLVAALAYGRRGAAPVRSILVGLERDARVIGYRQAVFADLDGNDRLVSGLQHVLPALTELDQVRQHVRTAEDNQLLLVLRRLRELELYVDTAKGLLEVLHTSNVALQSEALQQLRDALVEATAATEFERLAQELPQLRRAMRRLASVTVGINLDGEGRPVAATLLEVSDLKFGHKKSLIGRLLGGDEDEELAGVGLAALHEVMPESPNPFLQPLFRDLGEVLRLSSRPVAQALARYVHVSVTPLARLAEEVAFYLGAVLLARRLRAAGLAVSLPRLLQGEERATRFAALYNPCLALRMIETHPPGGEMALPVASDVDLGSGGRAAVLTGPNMGGKTTYLQAIALAQVLAQAGLFVPAAEAAISPADGIYTHFPKPEQAEKALGRLGEEAQRLSAVFSEASDRSLVLLNESLASTSPGESLYLAREVLAALRLLGARVVFATHLHELAADMAEVDSYAPAEPPTVSLVAGVRPPDEHGGRADLGRTYRIAPGPPQGKSYAEEIAHRHGISLEQLRQRLRDRGLGE